MAELTVRVGLSGEAFKGREFETKVSVVDIHGISNVIVLQSWRLSLTQRKRSAAYRNYIVPPLI